MPWQPADPGTIAKDAQGAFHIYANGAWLSAPAGSIAKDAQGTYHVNSDALGIAPKPDPIQQANNAANAEEDTAGGPVQHVINMLKAVPSGVAGMLEGMGKNAVEHPILGNLPALADTIRRVAANPGATVSSVGSALENATPEQVGRNVVGPMVAGGVAGEGLGAVSAARAASAAEAAADPAVQLGLRTATAPGKTLAGNSTAPTLNAQNQRVASSVLGADAGVPHNLPVTPATLADARVAPGQLLDQGFDLIPAGPLSPAARNQVLAARGPSTITKPTPNVAGQINDIESSLLDPNGQFTGDQLRATRNSLNSDATAGSDSADADTRAIAAYKRRVVGALDQHLADSLPQGSAITPDQVLNARATLAKNYQLKDLIGKGGDINLQALAKLHRESPDLLSGNTRTVAQFANDHPEVTGNITNEDRISPPSIAGDLANVNLLQRPLGSVGQALFGSVGRRLLRGPSGEAIGRAMQAPVAGLGGEFDVNPLSGLSPPPGQMGAAPVQRNLFPMEPGSGQVSNPTGGLTASPPSGPPPAAAAPASDIPLADLLSHGVEQRPAPGLSVAPIRSPEPQGIPFQRNAAHEAGNLELSPEDWLNNFLRGEPNGDHAGVMSQGVPEGIMQRANNASGESPASLEAISRGTRDLAIINPDGNEQPLLRDVTQIDQKPPKGSMIIDRSTGEIINRGGMSLERANGLRNRWATMGRTLGGHFTMGGAGG
jgi:hypothetical protein